jgi:EAL domain-containing protein (putative c-di-GMP-specific phosphodiesterase class I)
MADARPAPAVPPSVAPLLERPDALRTVYQPIVELRSGELAGYEALTRIADRPARSPRPWFEGAAAEGLGAALEAAALRSALLPRAQLPDGLFLSLNVDPAVIDDQEVTGVLLDEADLHGLLLELAPADASAAGRAATATLAAGPALAALRSRGALVAVDVVDGGVDDLHLVSAVRPDVVQLSPALVRDVHRDPVQERLVRLAVQVAHELGAVTLAQGIEEQTEARHLQYLGVTLGQGWLFGRARPGLLPPSPVACAWLRTTWQELAALTTVHALAVPIPPCPEAPGHPPDAAAEGAGGWHADLDAAGRLRGLLDPAGRPHPLADLVRLRAGQDLVGAAHRVLGQHRPDTARHWAEVAPVLDESGCLVGIVSVARLVEAAFFVADPTRGGGP